MTENEDENNELTVSSRFFKLLLVGIVLVIVGIIVVVAAFVLSGSGSVGVIIFIGPIPIVFGSGQDEAWLILVGIILMVVSAVLYFVMNRRVKGLTD